MPPWLDPRSMSAPSVTRKPVILVPVRYYLPGFRSGGPVRSVANLVESLGDEYDFRIVCLDRDFGQTTPYPNAAAHDWVECGKARIRYLALGEAGLARWRSLAAEAQAEVVYLNSLFDPAFSIVPLMALGWGRRYRIVLAPRGELSLGALGLKAFRKRAFCALSRLLRLHSGVRWHASSESEAEDIRREFQPADELVAVAPNLPNVPKATLHTVAPKTAGNLRVVFLSRISPKKNLISAIRIVSKLSSDVTFDIWGPIDDLAYWNACRLEMSACPENVRMTWRGEVPNEQVPGMLAEYDVFLLPTLGENFGHVIVEALSAGLPVVISDRTPWRNLREIGVGVDLPVGDEAAFVQALQQFQAMTESSLVKLREQCRAYVETWREEAVDLNQYRKMFDRPEPTTKKYIGVAMQPRRIEKA
jgi:glycosyltransferase involved in cell wall biosynthesis